MKSRICILIIVLSVLIAACEQDYFYPSEFNYYSSTKDSQIVFIADRTDNTWGWQLYKMNPDGREQTRITDLSVSYNKPVISHSGDMVLFVHKTADYHCELYLINIDGSNLTLIDRAKRNCGFPDWSPDDSKIIYSKNRDDNTDERDVILYDLNSGNKDILTSTLDNVPAKFTNNNKIIYCRRYDSSTDIYSMNIDGSDKKMIIPNAREHVISPDYKRIAYMSEYIFTLKRNDFISTSNSPQIFVADIDGSHSKQLTYEFFPTRDSSYPDFGNYDPQWTADGKMIVYESEINDGEAEIYIMYSDGSHKKQLTSTDGHNQDPVLSSDGKFILFASSRDLIYYTDIYVMNLNGENQKSLSGRFGSECLPVIAGK